MSLTIEQFDESIRKEKAKRALQEFSKERARLLKQKKAELRELKYGKYLGYARKLGTASARGIGKLSVALYNATSEKKQKGRKRKIKKQRQPQFQIPNPFNFKY